MAVYAYLRVSTDQQDVDNQRYGVLVYANARGLGPLQFVGLCRKVAFWRQNPKMGYWKINDLRASTFLFSVICDRAL
jgi:hypothetical protein